MSASRVGLGLLLGLLALAALAAAPAGAGVEPPVLLGIYPNGSFLDPSGAAEIATINTWFGDPTKAISIGANFMDLEYPNPAVTVPAELEGIWRAGLVPFVNLSAGYAAPRTAAQIAQGALDGAIVAWADAYRGWALGLAGSTGPRRAFIGPLQEMNGPWVPYGLDAEGFKQAYARIRSIFAQRGVPADSVRWVFAPNGWSQAGHEFERYYPGPASVDIVGFSAYNYGNCVWEGARWDTYAMAIRPYLDRMRVLAPDKPIFLIETGSVDDGGDKNAWLDDTFTQLAAYPALRAILYFHRRWAQGLPCDPVEWRFYAPAEGIVFEGVRNAVLRPQAGFGHWAPSDPAWTSIAFVDIPSAFDDVQPVHPFTGLDPLYYFDAVQTLVAAGVTGGCSATPPLYCPDAPVTREQMAVFLLKAGLSAAHAPPPCTAAPFADVPCSSIFAPWIQDLVARGITAGCGGGLYCPGSPVTREQMAVFLLRTLGVTPPACTTAPFTDVPCSSAFASWIQALVTRGITAGCAATAYCPTSPVTRAQMAVFLVKAFGIPLPVPEAGAAIARR